MSRAIRSALRRAIVGIGVIVLVSCVAVSVAQAFDLFADVPASSPHHNDVNALARAGITGGCAPGLYCPGDVVRRDQMASFLRRGFGRAAFGSAFQSIDVPAGNVTETPVVVVPLTIGLPGGAISGAAGFVQATAEVRFDVTNAVGCPCTFRAAIIDADTLEYLDGLFYAKTVLDATRLTDTIPITGRGKYTTPGTKNIAVVVGRDSGTGVANASANLSVTYAPFGADGTNEPAASTAVTAKSG